MKHFSKAIVFKALLIAASIAAIGIIAGCTSGLNEVYDINNIFFSYTTVSDSDGKYIIITKHIASQSDIKIPDDIYGVPVREIADSVFEKDEMIKTVKFGKNMRRIGNNAFGNCTNLESVSFNVSMSDIGEYAFQECTSLPSAELPKNLRSLGRGAFYGCKSLGELSIPDGIESIGGRAFSGTAWLKEHAKENYVTVCNGILIAYNGNKTEITVPKGIRHISGAFAGKTLLESVTLRNGITAIGDMAFMGCSSMKEINIPSTVTEIGNSAFYACKSVRKLVIPDSVQSIGSDAFKDCRAALFVKEGSYAEKYCADNGLDCFTMK